MKKLRMFVPVLFIFTQLLTNCADESKDKNTFIDPRDGHDYKTVTIEQQIWMAENLNYRTSSGSCYYFNDSATYSEQYGRLYNWQTSLQVSPPGWHLPSKSEWETLLNNLGQDTIVYKNMALPLIL